MSTSAKILRQIKSIRYWCFLAEKLKGFSSVQACLNKKRSGTPAGIKTACLILFLYSLADSQKYISQNDVLNRSVRRKT